MRSPKHVNPLKLPNAGFSPISTKHATLSESDTPVNYKPKNTTTAKRKLIDGEDLREAFDFFEDGPDGVKIEEVGKELENADMMRKYFEGIYSNSLEFQKMNEMI